MILLLFINFYRLNYITWSKIMQKKYGKNFIEKDYCFYPIFRKSGKIEKGLMIIKCGFASAPVEYFVSFENGKKESIHEPNIHFLEVIPFSSNYCFIFENGIKTKFRYNPDPIFREFKPFDEIEAIYPCYFRHKDNPFYRGLRFETNDLKFGFMWTPFFPNIKILKLLKSKFGDRWINVFKQDEMISHNEVHHYIKQFNLNKKNNS